MRGDERKHQRKTVRVRQLVLGARASPEGIRGKAKVYRAVRAVEPAENSSAGCVISQTKSSIFTN